MSLPDGGSFKTAFSKRLLNAETQRLRKAQREQARLVHKPHRASTSNKVYIQPEHPPALRLAVCAWQFTHVFSVKTLCPAPLGSAGRSCEENWVWIRRGNIFAPSTHLGQQKRRGISKHGECLLHSARKAPSKTMELARLLRVRKTAEQQPVGLACNLDTNVSVTNLRQATQSLKHETIQCVGACDARSYTSHQQSVLPNAWCPCHLTRRMSTDF